MLSKCFNSECTARFLYLHRGKLFKLNVDGLKPAGSGREYFWLCDECSADMTLHFRPGVGVIVVRNEREGAAAAD